MATAAAAAAVLTPPPMATAVGLILVPWVVTMEGTDPAGPVTAPPPTATGTETTGTVTGMYTHLMFCDREYLFLE